MSIWGIDISNHQAGADLSRAKAAGCSFVFAKATEGGTYRDPYFAGFYAQAQALGLPIGAYHFARPGNGRTGAQEAAFFVATLGSRIGQLPPVLDLEDTKLSAASTVAWALGFLQAVHKATGIRPIVYTYTAFARAHLGGGAGLSAYPLWLADYRSTTTPPPPTPAPWSRFAAWQHTSTARVPGIPGDCDRNITNLTVDQLKALGGTIEKDDLDMTPEERQKFIDDIAAKVWSTKLPRTNNDPVAAGSALGEGSINAWRAVTRLKALAPSSLTAAVTAAVAAAQPGVDVDALAKAIVLELGKDD